jgi:orotate phosphoribosyltransferase
MDDRERLLEMLVRYSYRQETEPVFRLASGRFSDVYINCKQTTMRRDAAPLIASLFEQETPAGTQAVGGLTAGADPIAYAMRDFCDTRPVHAFMVRKEPKDHGLRREVEGPVERGMNVVVIDDVVTSGSSTIKAVQSCRAAELRVVAVVVLVDRQEGGLEAIREEVGPRCQSPRSSPSENSKRDGRRAMATQIPQDLDALQDKLARRLAGTKPAYRFAVDAIVTQLRSIWDDEQGAEIDVGLLNQTISPKFDVILSASSVRAAEEAVDALVVAWSALAPNL